MKEKFSYAQQVCIKAAGKAMQQTGMLAEGARVGIAVSGGVDSFVLLKVMGIRQRIVPFHVEMMALHLNPGFDGKNHLPLRAWLEREGVAAHLELTDYGPRGHSGENKTRSACFYCARLRRKRLFALCGQYGLTHLAFGHNAEDLVSTFMLNLVQTGRVEGMGMNEGFFGGALRVIRPLLLVEKADIARAARQWALPVWNNPNNPCPSAGRSARTHMLELADGLSEGSRFRKKNIFNALSRWQFAKDKARNDESGALPQPSRDDDFWN